MLADSDHTAYKLSGQHLVSRVGVRCQNECKAYGVIRTLPIGKVAMVNNGLAKWRSPA